MKVEIIIEYQLSWLFERGFSLRWNTAQLEGRVQLTIYTLASVHIISMLSLIHFLGCWQGECVYQSKPWVGDHFQEKLDGGHS